MIVETIFKISIVIFRWNYVLDLFGLSFLKTTPYAVIITALATSVHKVKDAYMNLGRKLMAEGKLPDGQLILYLTNYEIGKLLCERNPSLVKK